MKRVLHLVRAVEPAPPEVMCGVADHDWIVYLDPAPELAARGKPPLLPGPIDHDQLAALIFAADLVVTW